MPIGQLIGQHHLVDEAAEGAENVVGVVQSHARAVNVETLPTYAPAQRKTNAHFVKM
jgi:uracil-DNA glycosylase